MSDYHNSTHLNIKKKVKWKKINLKSKLKMENRILAVIDICILIKAYVIYTVTRLISLIADPSPKSICEMPSLPWSVLSSQGQMLGVSVRT